MKPSVLIVFLLACLPVFAQQQVVVPENVYFADMHLKLSKGAQQSIQAQVDYLTKYPTYFQQKVDRADTYFPIIERIFKEEGLPEDFKYLVLQESGLVSDAVSTSNAVGFWQFKKEAASDFGIWVNNDIDERKHIVESSRGAAKYLKKHNDYYKNWIVSLLSYNLGFTGVKSAPEVKHAGKSTMPIEKDTHIYIQKFIAHKLAFENFVGKNSTPALSLQEYEVRGGGSLYDIAQATKVDIAELEKYNKWLIGSSIPNNKTYTVILPRPSGAEPVLAATGPVSTQQTMVPALAIAKPGTFVSLHGLKAIVAAPGDTKDKLALQAGISTRKFLKFNDLNSFDPIRAGETYYVQDKRSSANVDFYVAQQGEDLQAIAQKHGVKERSLRMKNRMKKHEVLVAGRKLWMKKTRPRHTPAEYERQNAATKPEPKKYAQTPAPAATPVASVTTASITSATPEVVLVSNEPVKPAAPKTEVPKTETPQQEKPKPAASTNGTEKPLYGNLYARPAKVTPVNQPESTPADSAELTEIADDSAPFDFSSLDELTADATEALEAEPAAPVSKPEPAAVAPKPTPAAPKPAPTPTPKPVTTAPVAAPAATPKLASAPAKATTHTVAKGETLYSISRRYDITPAQIQALNNLSGNNLAIGQELVVAGTPAAKPVLAIANTPAPETTPAPVKPTGNTHTVQPGETMYQIARRYNMTVIDLMELNSRTDTNLKPGDTITIKK